MSWNGSIEWFQNWITRLRWVIGGLIPLLIGVNEIWGVFDVHRLNQFIATLAALGLFSKGQSTTAVGAEDVPAPGQKKP